MRLIDALLPHANHVAMPGAEHLGPLTTTFLLAMATPMILLPLERVRRHRDGAVGAYMNERPLDDNLASAVDDALGGRCLKHSPFFSNGQWRFAKMPYARQNFALHFPRRMEQALEDQNAATAAANMTAKQWSSCLRNALAHGGVVYLDEYGRQSHGGSATSLAFISARYPRSEGPQAPDQLRALRIKEADFLRFLRQWAQWLNEIGLSRALAA